MISPELLRQYPFFGLLDEGQLREVAMLAKEETYESGEVIFRESDLATALYFLLEGSVDLYYIIAEMKPSSQAQGIPVGSVNPGEPFSISALIEPHILTATARTSLLSRVLKFDAEALRSLFSKDRKLDYLFTYQAARAAIERLQATRIQLAAAWA